MKKFLQGILFMVAGLLVIFLLIPSLCFGLTEYYVDPTYTDTGSDADGSEADPWTDISWSDVNTALASSPVTVYISATDATNAVAESISDVDGWWDRDDSGTNLLTIDGISKYNTDDAHESGSWLTNSQDIRFYLKNTSWPGPCFWQLNGPQSYIYMKGVEFDTCYYARGTNITFDDVVVNTGIYVEYRWYYTSHTVTGMQITDFTIKNSTFNQGNAESVYFGGNGNATLINFKEQTVNFVSNEAITGSTSGATATALRNEDDGATGTISLSIITGGPFTDDEVINGGSGGKAKIDGVVFTGEGHSTIVIENNTFIGTGGEFGAQADAIDIKDGNSNVTIRNNTITNYRDAGTRAIVSHAPLTVYGNKFDNNIGSSIAINTYWPSNQTFGEGGSSWTLPDEIKIYNNKISRHTGNTINVSEEQGNAIAKTVSIWNNSLDANIVLSGVGGQQPAICVVENNAVDGDVTLDCVSEDNDYNDITGTLFGASLGANSITSDPLFVSSTDFYLQSGSLAIDAGKTLTVFSDDIDGVVRPQDAAWDIGAYEFEAVGAAVPNSMADFGVGLGLDGY